MVIAGVRFKSAPDGTKPTVTFGGVPATVTAVAADGTSITVTTPASSTVGYVDVVVTNPQPNQSVTFAGGFLYYAGTLLEVSPNFANTAGGVQVTIRGVSLQTGATFTFGGIAATAVTHIDDTQYVVTVPAHPAGYVDVVMTETGGHTSTLRNGFQYTTLARGTDIRRYPGIQISKALGNGSWTATFSLDGQTNKPTAGEEIQITDPQDSGRVLFHGLIQMDDQAYEGQISQLVWNCTAGDFQYMLNKYRPFGNYTAVPADAVVRDLMAKYATSDFDLTFVQTALAPVTLTFDGTKTMTEAMDIVARAIGGGRWYLDGRSLHFFNPPAPTTIVVPAGSTGTGADFTAAILTTGNPLGTTQTYTQAYYSIRVSFLYSNGTESRLGPTSNVIPSDGQHYLTASSLPIGLNPSGSITCVGRRIYYLQGTNGLALAAEIDDNVTTTFSFAPLTTVPPTVGTNLVGDVVTQTQTGSTSGAASQATAFKPSFSADPFYYLGSDLGMFFEFGGTPKFTSVSTQADLRGGMLVQIAPGDSVGLGARSYAYWVKFAVSLTYPDGSTTQMSDPSGNPSNPFGGLFLGNLTSGSPGQSPQYTCFYYPGVIGAPLVNGQKPSTINLFMEVVGIRNISIGGGANDTPVTGPVWQQMGNVPYYDGTNASGATSGGTQLSSQVVAQAPTDFGQQPTQVPGQVQLTYVWPNPDGPYLEDYRNPHDITDTDTDLLHEDSNSQPFVTTEDITQLRNRVKVYGASSVTVADANAGDNSVAIANPAIFPIGGGQVVAANGVTLTFFSVSSQITSTNTPAKLLLTAPLTAAIPNGTVVSFYCMAEDKAAQAKRGKIELDAFGNPTDGVHEYVVIDQSLDTTQSVYLRANAELAIFKDPIITIKYATRNPTYPGSRVNVNLSNPPCNGTFLVQSVQIDQVRDEGEQLAPRYTVTATNVFYDLTNFLLLLTAGSQASGAGSQSSVSGGSNSSVGIVNSAAQLAQSSTSTGILDASALRGYPSYGASLPGNTTPTTIFGGSHSWTGGGTTTNINDARGSWLRLSSTAVGNANSAANSAFSFRADQNPILKAHFRIPVGITVLNQRWWLGFKQPASPIFPNSDSIVGGGVALGVRFSTVAGDGGFRLFTSDNVTQNMGDTLTKTPLTSGYEYDFALTTIGGGAAFTVTITSYVSATGVQVATDTRTLAIPQGTLGITMSMGWFQYQVASTPQPVQHDLMRLYMAGGLGL